MASITDAFKIIADELPKFFTETNTPFLGKDEEQSVMKEKSSGQKEKEVSESLLKLGAAAPAALLGGAKVAQLASQFPKIASTISSALGFAQSGDPLDLVPGRIGKVIGSTGEAEASIVPASRTHLFEDIQKVATRLAKGDNPELVYKSTGLYKGPKDNIMRSVISDEGVQFKDTGNYIDQAKTLGELIDHPALFKAMPELRDIKVSKIPQKYLDNAKERGATILGGYDSNKNELQLNFDPEVMKTHNLISTILHETQHKIQKDAGFVQGSTVAAAQRHPETEKIWNQIAPSLPKNMSDKEFNETVNTIGRDVYLRGAGEAEARATQRMYETGNFTSYPPKQYDVDIDKLLFPNP